MAHPKKLLSGRRRRLGPVAALTSVALLAAPLFAQQPPGSAGAPQGPSQGQQAAPEHHINPREAQDLFRSVDEIAGFVSQDTGLPLRSQVKKELTSRDAVQRYVEKKMDEDEDAKRLARSSLVLKKFGLLPRSFQLQPFLVSLLREQIAGYYDFKTRTVYLLDWIAPELQRPVMAHELTHALQDQTVGLEKWEKEEQPEPGRDVAADNTEVAKDEASTARNAVVEGQGMTVLVDYMLRPSGRTILTAPEAVPLMMSSMDDSSDSPVLAAAPLLLRDSLIFPYREGLKFVSTVLRKQGASAAYRGALEHPPTATWEILYPEVYVAGQQPPPTLLPDVHPILDGLYESYDVGAIGAIDVRLMAETFGMALERKDTYDTSRELARSWRGGGYYAARRRSAAGDSTAGLGLLYVSNWDTPASAERFASLYTQALGTKYRTLKARPGKAEGERRFETEEGLVAVLRDGNRVVVTEGFEPALAEKLQQASLVATGSLQVASERELGLDTIQALHGLVGVPRSVVAAMQRLQTAACTASRR